MMSYMEGVQSWLAFVRFVKYYFSIDKLLRTLFIPWHRDRYEQGEGFMGFIESLVFAIFTRILGFFIRSLTIILGLIAIGIAVLLFPVFFLFRVKLSFEELSRFGSLGKTWAYPRTFYLDKHGRDLRFLPETLVIDHDHGIKKLEQVLSRKEKRDALIIGEPGVGKTTRLAYLARRMYRDLSTPELNSKRLVELFPEKMSQEELDLCIQEAVHAKNIVLVIENIEHFNILEVLRPYFQHKYFQMIVSTDFSSYHGYFKLNSDFMSLVEMIEFFPPRDEVLMLYLIDWCERHGIRHRFSNESLSAIIILSNKLVMNKFQPQKAMDILMELASFGDDQVSPEDVEAFISEKTGVPLGVLQGNEKQKLMHLEETLNQYVIGQEEAVHAIASALKRARLEVRDTQRPIGSFLFLGTTGVGKTHTAKGLAQYYFEDSHLMIRFDMSEFSDSEALERFLDLLGARVEEHPYALVFFDEIEKANPAILDLFLQMLDEGVLHTTKGRIINFQNTIIIATSNAGADYLMENEEENLSLLTDYIIEKGIFKPEFINRFDAVILFKPLKREGIKKVARLLIHDLSEHLKKKHNLTLVLDEDLIDYLAREGHSLNFGLRPLRRLIQNHIETAVADILLRDEIPEDRIIKLSLADIKKS